ncbi:hypothetical protein BH09BAC5_BH09BAC5_16070 [soil metagenome]
MAASLSLGKFLVGTSLFTIVINWFLEASRPDPIWIHYRGKWNTLTVKSFFRDLADENFKPKWRLFKSRPAILVLMLVVVLHLIGTIWSPDQHEAWKDIKIKLPLLLVPLVIGTTPPLNKKLFELLLLTFVVSVFISTLSTILIANGIIHTRKPIMDIRDASVFVPLMRLSLMCALSVFFLCRWIYRKKRFLFKTLSLILIFWFLWFLQYMQSLTGLFILFSGGLILTVAMLFFYKRRITAIVLTGLFLFATVLSAWYMTNYYKKNFTIHLVDENKLEKFTAHGNAYLFEPNYPMIENGHQVRMYFCWKELDSAWATRSKIDFNTGTDINGNPIHITILRYLTSANSRKDADAINRLSDEEISEIEKGETNILNKERSPLERRTYQVCWELYHYFNGANPSGNSVTMRLEFAKTAVGCIKQHPWIGAGTGGQQKVYEETYNTKGTLLTEEYQWMHAHNQFLSIGVCLGIPALLYFIFSLWYAPMKMKRWRSYLYLAFFLVVALSFIDDDTLETSQGVNFFAFFNALFLFSMPRESALRVTENENLPL